MFNICSQDPVLHPTTLSTGTIRFRVRVCGGTWRRNTASNRCFSRASACLGPRGWKSVQTPISLVNPMASPACSATGLALPEGDPPPCEGIPVCAGTPDPSARGSQWEHVDVSLGRLATYDIVTSAHG
jgi:hypothetical protein